MVVPSRKGNRFKPRKTTLDTKTTRTTIQNKHSRRTNPVPVKTQEQQPAQLPAQTRNTSLGMDIQAYGSEDNIPPIDDSTITINKTNTDSKFSEIEKELVKQEQSDNPTYDKETKNYTNTVYFKNLHGKGQITGKQIKTKFKPTDQQLRMLGAMELQKAGVDEEQAYISQTAYSTKISKKNFIHTTNSKKYHGNTFNHMTNAAGDYMKLSSDGSKKGNTNYKMAKVDSNKNPIFVKRDSGYAPPTYGDRELPGIGRVSLTGFAGGIHKKGSKTVSGKRRTEDSPFSFNWEEPRRSGYEKVQNSSGIPQWMGGLKKNHNTKKVLQQQLKNRTVDKKARTKRGEIKGAMKRFKNKGSSNKNIGTASYDSIYNKVEGTEDWDTGGIIGEYQNLGNLKPESY